MDFAQAVETINTHIGRTDNSYEIAKIIRGIEKLQIDEETSKLRAFETLRQKAIGKLREVPLQRSIATSMMDYECTTNECTNRTDELYTLCLVCQTKGA